MRAAKIDANHSAVVSALRKAGCRVLSLAGVGRGCPDILVYLPTALSAASPQAFMGGWHLFEIKDGAKPPSERRLTPDQVKFHAIWPVTVVTSPAEALRACGLG